MALRPRAVITTPYPTPAATARVLGVTRKRYLELMAMVTDALARRGKRSASNRPPARRRAAHRSSPIAARYPPHNAFLNVPYDARYEKLFVALIAGLCAFGLRPRATLEIPGGTRRLDRILELISVCRYSFHDLSRIQLSRGAPRFNMPFEIGLAVATARWRPAHQWFLFEARPFRVQHTLSDLGGTDAYAHGEGPRRLLIALTDALVGVAKQPTVDELYRIFRRLSDESIGIRRNYGTLFGARAFRDLVVLATGFVAREVA